MFEKSSIIFKLVYEIKDRKPIKFFDNNFAHKNKNIGKFKMIINNKLYSINNQYQMVDDNKKILKIKLVILNDKGINFRKIFYECKSLKEFSLISQDELKQGNKIKEDYKTNQFDNLNTYDSEGTDKELSNKLIYSNETNKKINN